MKAWILGAILLLGVVAVLCFVYFTDIRDKHSKAAEKRVAWLREQITKEAATLGEGHWAGHYCYYGLVRVQDSLSVAPESGVVFESYTDLGLNDRNFGTVQEKNDRIHLDFKFKNDKIPSEYLFIRWGKKRYLISPDEIVNFCNEINSGEEPDDEFHFYSFLLNDEDEGKPVEGLPDLPEEYRPYLLKRPIETRLEKIIKTSVSKDVWIFRTTVVRLDVGQNDGVLPGMEFHLQNSDCSYGSATVRKIAEDFCEAEMSKTGNKTPDLPKVGWKFSTTLRGNPEKKTIDTEQTGGH